MWCSAARKGGVWGISLPRVRAIPLASLAVTDDAEAVPSIVGLLNRFGIRFPGIICAPDRTAVRLRSGLERALHDGAASELSAVALDLGMLAASSDAGTESKVDMARSKVTKSLDELRWVGSVIYPSVLASAGLGPALRAVAERRNLKLTLDLPTEELGEEACSRAGLLAADHFQTLPERSAVRVRVRGKRIVRVTITEEHDGQIRNHRAAFRCA